MAAPASSNRLTAVPFVLSGHTIVRRRLLVCGVLVLVLIGCILVGVARGAVYLPESEVARLLLRGLGLAVGLDLSQADFTIIWTIRLPRVLIGGLVGAALATSGGTLQGLFHNPLADPGLLGISMGGSLGGVIAISS